MNKNALAPAVLLLSMGFTLAGCQTRGDVRPFSSEVPPPPQFVALAEKCNANDARFALGQKITPPLLEDARGRAGARSAIAVRPGELPQPADPLRLVVEVDAEGKMVGARCS